MEITCENITKMMNPKLFFSCTSSALDFPAECGTPCYKVVVPVIIVQRSQHNDTNKHSHEPWLTPIPTGLLPTGLLLKFASLPKKLETFQSKIPKHQKNEWNDLELTMKKTVPGVSLKGMSLSIDKTQAHLRRLNCAQNHQTY